MRTCTVNDEEKTAEFVYNVVRIHIAPKKWRENEGNVSEGEAVYYHDCDERGYLAQLLSWSILNALRPVNVTREECT